MMSPDPTTAVNNAAATGDTTNVFAAFQAMSALGFTPEEMAHFFHASAQMSAPGSPQASLNVPRSLNDTLPSAVLPQSPHTFEEVPALRRQDYPQVRWWYKSDWVKHEKSTIRDFSKSNERGGTRAANGVNVRYQFMENTQGVVVSGYRATDARARFREFNIHLYKAGRAPDTWVRGIDSQDRVNYDAWMAKMVPELRLCHNSWKARELAVKEYPQWKPAYDKRVRRRKELAEKRAAALLLDGAATNDDVYNDEEEDDPQAAEDERNAVNVDLFLQNAPYTVEPSAPSLKRPFNSVEVVPDANVQPGSSKRPRVNNSGSQTQSETTATNTTTTETTVTESPAAVTSTTDMTATKTAAPKTPTTTATTSTATTESTDTAAPKTPSATETTATGTTAMETAAPKTPTTTGTTTTGTTATGTTVTETAATDMTPGDTMTNATGGPGLKITLSTPSDSTSATTVIVTPAAAPPAQHAHVVAREIPDLFDILPWSRTTSAQNEGNTEPSTTGPPPKTQPAVVPGKDAKKTALPKTMKKKAVPLLEVWPPLNGSELKDRCARAYADENGTTAQLDFNAWYEKASYYFKKKLADKDPAQASRTKPAAVASGSGASSKSGTIPAE
ncbi:hypothetical protein VTO73DRAFT_13802 [Trametes versicolor]